MCTAGVHVVTIRVGEGASGGVLSMWKLRVGVEAYYLAQVASGLDDYYAGAGEAPGVWMGGGTDTLALSGQVAGEALQAVLSGLAPGTALTPNGDQNRARKGRIPGFDLTFSVPKSVSVLYALADPRVQALVIEAGERAVGEAFNWLERDACFVRRGTNDERHRHELGAAWGTRRMTTHGFVAARFSHRTSRASDPQLHWHVLVANLAQGVDGRWSALDGTALYAAKRAAGVLFQTALRRELVTVLGVEWGPMVHDVAEIAGIPRPVLRAFSQRREQIEEWLDEHGRSGPVAAQDATLATRPAKPILDPVALDSEWKQRATTLGWGPAQLEQLLDGCAPVAPVEVMPQSWLIPIIADERLRQGDEPVDRAAAVAVTDFDGWLAFVLEHRLTAGDALFDRRDLIQAVAASVPAGTSVATIERVVERALADPKIVALTTDETGIVVHAPVATVIADHGETRYTSRLLVELEARFLTQITRPEVGHRACNIDASSATRAVEVAGAGGLGADQAAAWASIVSSRLAVQVLVGRAGTGKTHTVGAVRASFQAAGWTVVGLAPSARAARELEDGAHVRARTIATHLLTRHRWNDRTLVIVDEAGMANTRDLARVIDDAAGAGARVLLVGDPHQLPEVGAGGGLSAAITHLAGRAGGVNELTINRRQHHRWEHDALDELRNGNALDGWATYHSHDRVHLAANSAELYQQVLDDWWKRQHDGADVVLVAGTRQQAHAINQRARQLVNTEGRLTGPETIIDGRSYRVGDRVICLRNDRYQTNPTGLQAAVENGTIATITALDRTAVTVSVTTRAGRAICLDRDYVEHGGLDHGYAVTVHKAQGVTCDHLLVVGPDGLYREAIYVAMSRARHGAHLYATVREHEELTERHQRGIRLPSEPDPDDIDRELATRLTRSGAKQFAHHAHPDLAAVAALADHHSGPRLTAMARRAHRIETGAPLPHPDVLARRVEHLTGFHRDATIGAAVVATDRNNIGTITGLDPDTATASVAFISARGRTVYATVAWDQLHLTAPDTGTSTLPASATATGASRYLTALTGELIEQRDAWATYLAAHHLTPGDADRYRQALTVTVDRHHAHLLADQPDWLTTLIGPQPADQNGRIVWTDLTHDIAHWRTTRHTRPTIGLGPTPTAVRDLEQFDRLLLRIAATATWAATRTRPARSPITLTPGALYQRRQELAEILAGAPDDQRHVIDRLLAVRADPDAVHQVLTSAHELQHDRRQWILEHWPHLVELNEIDTLIAQQPPLAHWPAASDKITATLALLAASAAPITSREDTTLHQLAIDQDATDATLAIRRRIRDLTMTADNYRTARSDPVRSPSEREHAAVQAGAHTREASRLRNELDHLQGARLVSHYTGSGPTAFNLRADRRRATVAHDTVTRPPAWVVEHVRRLDESGQLDHIDIGELADEVTGRAIDIDRTDPAPTPSGRGVELG